MVANVSVCLLPLWARDSEIDQSAFVSLCDGHSRSDVSVIVLLVEDVVYSVFLMSFSSQAGESDSFEKVHLSVYHMSCQREVYYSLNLDLHAFFSMCRPVVFVFCNCCCQLSLRILISLKKYEVYVLSLHKC